MQDYDVELNAMERTRWNELDRDLVEIEESLASSRFVRMSLLQEAFSRLLKTTTWRAQSNGMFVPSDLDVQHRIARFPPAVVDALGGLYVSDGRLAVRLHLYMDGHGPYIDVLEGVEQHVHRPLAVSLDLDLSPWLACNRGALLIGCDQHMAALQALRAILSGEATLEEAP